MGRLEQKTAIVTGGATGIGEAIAKRFCVEGAKVLIIGLPDNPVDAVVKEIEEKGGEALAFHKDISSEENVKEALKIVIDKWQKLDILINNAGVFPESNTADEFSVEAFDNLIKNNVRTTFMFTKYALPELQKTKGCIVSAGSESAILGIPEVAVYGGTKAFNHAFTKGIAGEQAKNGVRANIVAPGAIDTAWTHKETGPMNEEMEKTIVNATPMGRRGTVEEVANIYLFLVSDEASYVTGSVYSVDGGITIGKGAVGQQVPDEMKDKDVKTDVKHSKEGATEMK
ncbi:SDR family NAD(P)-dependent oxidoreductase [Autumnicola psychrophila]|uniref:SDR family NAD(P)-dependent oxidoreductase n=1 Tax=Autumnicola psychrophila TaxID=3075592 RepID=A0ABU3DN04_9FLAO|nr:SDR family NAD(P)-dependent oxidoreductase [Zunongwangia sp. F225]MDT0685103.1 SDR family NAD(P)-dependent oxidoreductase [Zunongwangia sp. F225]